MNALHLFRRPLWFLPLTLALAMSNSGLKAAEDNVRPDLRGTVLDETGKPITNATVFIYTAGPKQGTGVLCPSCYADCRKRTATSGNGGFTIASLDPELRFQVLVVAASHQPKLVSKV